MNSTNKIFAILIVLAMSAVVGFAAITADANAANDDKIDTYQELQSAIGGSEPTVKLDGDITYGNGDNAIVISRDVTIDLNGHNISCDHGRIFQVHSANVVLDGKGTISATTSATTSSTVEYNSSVIRVGDADATKASSLTVGRDVTVSTDKMYTVTVFNNKAQGQDCELIVKGTILHYQYFKDSSGTEIWDNAAVSTNGNDTNNSSTIRIVDGGMIYSEHSVGIYLPSGKVEMTGGAVTGYTAIYSKAGQINIAGGNILATGKYHAPEHTATGVDAFKCPTGDAIVLESCGYLAGVPSLKITDGQVAYTSADEHVHQYLDFPVEGCVPAHVEVDPKVSSNVAKVGNTEYPTLQRALAQANGTQKVTLLKDTVTAGFEIDDAGTYKGVNLDLGDFTVVCGVPGNNTLFKIANDNGLGVDGNVSGNNALFKITNDNANKPNVTITAGQNGGIVADTVFYSANGSNLGDLTIDGGKYSTVHYGYPFIIYGSKNVTIKNAAIEGMVWFGNMGAEKFTADKMTVHTVRDVAIYLGVVKSATLTDVTSTSETGTALEIKSGDISVIGGKYTGYQFAPSNGQIGPSGSGDGLATVFINNQYCLAAQVDKVSVSIRDADLGYSYRSSIEDYIYIVNDNQTYPISLICPDVHEVQYFANGKENTVMVNGRNAAVVAKVSIDGGEAVEYTSIEKAFEATNGKNAVISLLSEIIDAPALTVTSGSDVTLDLNGFRLSGCVNGVLLTNQGKLTIDDSSAKWGFVYNTDLTAQEHDQVRNSGTLIVNAGYLGDSDHDLANFNGINRGAAVRNVGSGTVTINGGFFTAGSNWIDGEGWAYAIINGKNAGDTCVTTIEDATVYGDNNGNVACNYGSVVVKDGLYSISGPKSHYNLYAENGSIEVSGGLFLKSDAVTSSGASIYVVKNDNASVTVNEGTFVNKHDLLFAGKAPVINRGVFNIDPKGATIPPTSAIVTYHDMYYVTPAFTVKFDANGGTKTMADQTLYMDVPVALNANQFTREGYNFMWWNTQADGKGTTYGNKEEVTLTENTTLYAIWQQKPAEKYTVFFDANGGSAVGPVSVDKGKIVEKPENPTKANSKFAGWFSDADLKVRYTFTEPVTKDITLYAKWTDSVNVSVPSGEGYTSTPAGVTSVTIGKEFVFTITAKTGYEIKSITANGKEVGTESGTYTIAPDSDVSISVVYTKDGKTTKTAESTIDNDDGTVTENATTTETDASGNATISEKSTTKDGQKTVSTVSTTAEVTSTSVSVKVDGSTDNVTVSESIAKAIAAAGSVANKNVSVSTPKKSVTIDKEAWNILGDADVTVTVNSNADFQAAITVSKDSFDTQSTLNLSVVESSQKIPSDIGKTTKAFELSAKMGGNTVTRFSDEVKVVMVFDSIPATATKVYAYCIDTGDRVEATFNAQTGEVTFDTPHFSSWTIIYEEPSGGNVSTTALVITAIILALVLIITAAAFRPKNENLN